MKLLVIGLMIVGITMVLNGYFRTNTSQAPPKIVYRYVPRTLAEEQNNPAKVSDIFSTM